MQNYRKLGFFLIPGKEMNRELLDMKKYFKKFNNKQNFLNHFPHLTLFHGLYRRQEDVIERLKKEKDLITNIKDYKYKIQKQFIFEDDLENGFSTLVYLVNNKNELQNFQENLLNTFIPEARSDFTKLNNEYKNDFLEKNYPFIGSKYIPHFTITNIEKLSNSEKEQFLNKSVTIFEKFKQLVVGEIFDDEIKVLEKLW
tara:strand:+ start:202 stop:798 length:597 start_codon:yes stop_codon:yes gene_type:complete